MQPVLGDNEAKNAVKLVVKLEGLRDYSWYTSAAAKRRLDVRAVLRLVKKDVDLHNALKMPAGKIVQTYILYLVWKNFENRIECIELGTFYPSDPDMKIGSIERQGDRMVVGLNYKNLRFGSLSMEIAKMKLMDEVS